MNIAGRLRINALLAAAMVLVVSLVTFLAFLMEREARERALLANNLRGWAYELTIFGNSYLRHPGERSREQWTLRYDSIVKALEDLPIEGRGQQLLVKRMRQNLNDLQIIFAKVVASSGDDRLLPPGLQDQLAGLMLQHSREITLDAGRLASSSNAEMEEIGRSITAFLPVVAVGLSVLAFWLSMRIGRSIAGPIGRLRVGAETIGAGNLEYRIGKLSDDELGELAGAFDWMAQNLKATTVSREELAREVAERKRAEAGIRQLNVELERRVEERTAELTLANRELEAFTYTVSHDLRAPLRHVTSFVELLEKEAGPKLEEQGRRYTRIISEAAARMAALIDDLLMFSRLGRTTLSATAVDLRLLVEEARRELAPEMEGRAIDWQIGALPQVRGDESLLRSVMVNLLSNAIKYTGQRELARIEVGSREQDNELVIFVRDNGAGFDMRFAGKLFGVFQRLHPAQQFEGTGIGLASVRRIIERHGGRTWAEGEVDRGATFSFSLPAQKLRGFSPPE